MREEILRNISKGGYINPKYLGSIEKTIEECYVIVYDVALCKFCGSKAKFKNWRKGFYEICDLNECNKLLRKERTERTNMEKYGVKNISQLQDIKDRKLISYSKTNLERYGVENVFSSKEIMFKDGVHCCRTEEANDKRDKVLLEKYGTTDTLSIKNGRERGLEKCHSEEIINKVKKTNLERYGFEHHFQSKDFQEYIKECNINRYGVENNMYREDVKERHKEACIIRDIKKKEDIDENGLNSFHRAMVKAKKTNIDNGHWISDDNKSEFEIYYREVWKYTNRNDLSILENIEKRGHANKGMHHLDHKYSIFQGFKDNILASIIGNINNLEMIIGRNNISKGRKCSISKDELLGLYYEA